MIAAALNSAVKRALKSARDDSRVANKKIYSPPDADPIYIILLLLDKIEKEEAKIPSRRYKIASLARCIIRENKNDRVTGTKEPMHVNCTRRVFSCDGKTTTTTGRRAKAQRAI